MADESTTTEPRPGADDLDEVFRALAHPWRRTAIAELADDGTVELPELAEAIAEDRPHSAEDAKVELVHRHLPRLDDAGVVEYDASDYACELTDDDVLEILSTVRELR